MNSHSNGIKKGQQLTMPMARLEHSHEILNSLRLEIIDIRTDWKDILSTINKNKTIQREMENAYQDFQEGFKLKDFKHPNVNGPWTFQDSNQGIFPYILTTTSWLNEYEAEEWLKQANTNEHELKLKIDEAIEKCSILDKNSKILSDLNSAKFSLLKKYTPRSNQPETWRPQNAAHWCSKWIKSLAEIHYKSLSTDWKIVESNHHSIVAGFGENNTAFLIDIVLLTNNPNEILKEFEEY